MKKNISINISGIIFHIEEDAYERLRDYLDSINRYFSNFEDSLEIIADIESRIAEIFLAKLNENKQVINEEDVEDLITTMGSIKDFQAVEEQADESYEQESQSQSESSSSSWKETSSRKLYRDEKRKLLGGVCAGIAHYFNMDPLWVRLIFVILFFASYGSPLIVYIIMWIVVPGNVDIKENKKLKKMYRNPEGKVIAGVASGIAAYFAVDVAVVRLIFVLTAILGGTGLIAYIILWIVLPEALSITDRVQMQGDPVTLSNIETNIKKNLNVKDGEEENIFVKILLFPFRLIATIINGIARALGPILLFLVEFIRVAVGVFMVFVGMVTIFTLVIVLGVVLGLVSTVSWSPGFIFGEMGVPLDIMADTFPLITSLAAFFGILIPCVLFILLGISLVAKRIIFNATVGWSLFAIFILSVITLSANVPAIVYKFREDGEHRITTNYQVGDKTAVLSMREVGMEDYSVTRLRLRGHEEPDYKLEQIFESQGSSRKQAIENAQMVTYNVELEDSIFTFDSNIQFKEDAVFRGQRLEMTLYIPYNKPFMMSRNLEHIIYNTIHRSGYDVWDMPNNTWMIDEKGLHCVTCEDEEESTFIEEGYDQTFEFRDFRDIEIGSAFTVDIEQSNEYKVYAKGEKRHLDEIKISQNGDKLYIDYRDSDILDLVKDRDAIKVKILMPHLEDVELTGAAKLYLGGFEERHMSFSLRGASYVKANIEADDLELDLSGASEMQLEGNGREMIADISGASHLNAYDYEVRSASVEAHGASSARVFVTEELEIEETLASNVKYKGDARVVRESDGL